MKILVTGGAGFIGSHLAKRLIQEGHDVCVVDNLSTGTRANLPEKAAFLKVDLSSPDFAKQLPNESFDAVCHLAAQSSGEISGENPYYDLQANAASTLVLTQWCLRQKITRFLYASSMSVYGNVISPVKESAVCTPLSYYGLSKLTSEHLLRIAQQKGLQPTSFRMFSVYGPGQNMANLKQGMVSIYLAYLLKGERLPVTGSFNRTRDFIYIDDVVDAWMKALSRPSTPNLVYNLGSGIATRVGDLIRLLIEKLNLPADYPVDELPGSSSDTQAICASIGSIQTDLGWSPSVPLAEGLATFIAEEKNRAAHV